MTAFRVELLSSLSGFFRLAFLGLKTNIPRSYMESEKSQNDSVINLLAWFEVHKKRIAIGAAIASVVIFLGMVMAQRAAEKEFSASAALSDVRLPFSSAAAVPAGAADSLAKVAADHRGSQAAARALLLSAGVLFAEAKSPADYAAAEKRFAQVIQEYPDSPWTAQANLGVASALKAQGNTAAALAKYEDITKRFASSPVIDEARLALARLYEKDKPEDAFKLYDEIMKGNPNSVLTMEATMRQDDLMDARPELKQLKEAAIQAMNPPPTPNQQVKITPVTNTAAGTTSKPVEIKLTPTATPGAANTPAK